MSTQKLALLWISETLADLESSFYKFSEDYAPQDIMSSIQLWIRGQDMPSSRLTARIFLNLEATQAGETPPYPLEEMISSRPVYTEVDTLQIESELLSMDDI